MSNEYEPNYMAMFHRAIVALSKIDDALGMAEDSCNDTGATIAAIRLIKSKCNDDDIELEQMRLRLAEMATEVERLNAVIDAANAQEPASWDRYDSDRFVGTVYKLPSGMQDRSRRYEPRYARPIPVQQTCKQAIQLLAESRENFKNQFGFSDYAEWVYRDLSELLIRDFPDQQSPAVAVPDEHPWRESMSSNHRSYAEGFNACRAKVLNSNQSHQRVTEQDAREIESTECIDNIPILGATDFTDYIDGLQK